MHPIISIFKNKPAVRWISYFLLVFFFILLMMDQIIMPWYVRYGKEMELPDVVELSIKDAQNRLEADDFRVVIVDSVYDNNFPVGTVVEQMPLPFTTVKSGRYVYLKLSIGEKPIIMPNLFYKSPRDAEVALKSLNLPIAKYYDYSDDALDGVVIAQSYPAGQIIRKGTQIALTISLGPFPKQPVIPHLVHKSLRVAKKQLKDLGVKNIKVTYEERNDILPETVFGQNLAKGVLITEETEIELLVSKLKQNEEN